MSSNKESDLYLSKSQTALEQSRANLQLGYYDVAISRAYYAMFYAATALLRSKDIAPANTAEYSRRLRNSLLNPV